MKGIFKEFENENQLRSYPFAAGCDCDIPPGTFVDAALYPVNPNGVLYLSRISPEGVFYVSDSSGVIMSGTQRGSSVEFFDTSYHERHVGTLLASSQEALSLVSGEGSERLYEPETAAFAAGCVFPIVVDGVSSLDVGGTGRVYGTLSMANLYRSLSFCSMVPC